VRPADLAALDTLQLQAAPLVSPDRQVIRLELGYPGPDFFVGQDPRSDPRILDALESAGKLR
jgi:hypothetical protein